MGKERYIIQNVLVLLLFESIRSSVVILECVGLFMRKAEAWIEYSTTGMPLSLFVQSYRICLPLLISGVLEK